MPAPWPSEEARERYIRFLELELLLMDRASHGRKDEALLSEMNGLLEEHFPRASGYIRWKLEEGSNGDVFESVGTIAWAEARSITDEAGVGRVPGGWTPEEIAADIQSCFDEALGRVGL